MENIENSINYLKSSAEYRIKQANTPEKVNSANRFVDIVNTIIEYHDKVQELQEQLNNTKENLDFIFKMCGVADIDRDSLQNIDSKFLRYHLLENIARTLKLGGQPLQERWLYHDIVLRWDNYQYALDNVKFYKKALEEYGNTGVIVEHYKRAIQNYEEQIKNYTNYSKLQEIEEYLQGL